MPEAITISSDVSQGFNWLQSYDYETQNRFIFTAKDNGYLLLNLSKLDDDLDLYITYPNDDITQEVRAGEEEPKYMLSSTNLGKKDETILLRINQGKSYVIDINNHNESDLTTGKYTLSLQANTFEQLTGSLSLLPNDPDLRRQWHLFNEGYNLKYDSGWSQQLQSPQSDIQAPKGWKIRHDASEVIVAIIDAGIDISHPDLQPNLWNNPGEIPGNGEDDDNNGLKDDIHGWNFAANNDNIVAHPHGTHVGGLVGAAGNNGIGGSGVAWSTQLMSLDVTGGGTSAEKNDSSPIAEAIRYAVDNGARVINISMGGNHKINPNHYNFNGSEEHKALQYAYDSDVFLSISAGNEGGLQGDIENWTNVGNLDNYTATPAFYARHLGNIANVGATNAHARKSGYSNYNGSVNIYAPGGDSNDGGIYSTLDASNGDYGSMNGTSQAAPVISGIAALIRAENPSLSAPETLSIIRATANNVPDGHGSELQIANLHQALTLTQRWKGPDTLTQIDQEIAPIFNLSALTMSQALTGQLTLTGDSAHDSVVGFYRVLDADGTVLDALGNSIKPGDANYQSIALNAGNLVDELTNLEINNEASNPVNYSLAGSINGVYLAPYIISGDNTWFAWSEANSDGLNRFKVLGANRFGFEDQAGDAGNGDFNDLVLSFASQQIL